MQEQCREGYRAKGVVRSPDAREKTSGADHAGESLANGLGLFGAAGVWASHGMQASVGPVWCCCMGPRLGGLLNLADLKKKPNGPHWIQMDSRPVQKKNDERSK